MLNVARLAFAATAIVVAWIAYTLVRGEIVDWYPYPFVDVSKLGYGGMLGRSVGLTLGFALGAAALPWLGNRRAER